jgi:ribosome modulation factor
MRDSAMSVEERKRRDENPDTDFLSGWRDGHCDRLLGVGPLMVALLSENADYARGYRLGIAGVQRTLS